MPVSVKNLVEAVEAAHQAIIVASNKLTPEDKKSEALLGAADQLCRQLGSVHADPTYWNALKGGTSHPDAASLSTWLSELAANKDQRRDDLATLFRLIGYRPPDASSEVVRGLVSSLHAASLLGIGKHSTTHAGLPDATLLKIAQDSLKTFTDQFCSAEKHLKQILRNANTLAAAKKEANGALLRLVKWGAGVMTVAVIGAAAVEAPKYLPPEANAYVCEHVEVVPDTVKPMVKYAFCALPNDAIDEDVRLELLSEKIRVKEAELNAALAELEAEIERGQVGTEAHKKARKLADEVREAQARLKAKVAPKFKL